MAAAEEAWAAALLWLASPEFYAQIGIATVAYVAAQLVAVLLGSSLKRAASRSEEGPASRLTGFFVRIRPLIFPILAIILVGFAVELSARLVGQTIIVRIAQSLAVILLLYRFVSHFVSNIAIVQLTKWVGIPVALLYVFGWSTM